MWNQTLDSFSREKCGIFPSDADQLLYIRHKICNLQLVIMVYIYYILFMSIYDATLLKSKAALNSKLKMKYLGLVKWFLEMKVEHNEEGVSLAHTFHV